MSRRIFSILLAASTILVTYSILVTFLMLYRPVAALTMPSFFSSLFLLTQAIAPYLPFATGLVGIFMALRQRARRWASVFALTLLLFMALPLLFSLALGGEATTATLEQQWSVLTYESVVDVTSYGAGLPLIVSACLFLRAHQQSTTQRVQHVTA